MLKKPGKVEHSTLNVDNVENVRKMIELNKKMKNWHEKK
jgi:hypothetical protein